MRWLALLWCTAALLAAPPAASANPAPPVHAYSASLEEAVAALPELPEARDGYQRSAFKHWTDEDGNGCDTRSEVLLAESTATPTIRDPGCHVLAGQWPSWYDGVQVTDPGRLDIDHMVPLAEAWDSGASAWTAQERSRYANDLGDARALTAVTARANRSKADQDPAQWLPPDAGVWCRYAADWTAVKHRWRMTADQTEKHALALLAQQCPATHITVLYAR